MKPFPKLHLWLLLPFLLTILGFSHYWKDFSNAPFRWHLHGITATLWYLVLIIQPWLYHHKPIQVHRKLGMVGIILAGMVAASALGVLRGNLTQPEQSPLFEVRYSLTLLDFIFVSGFLFSVVAAILNSKNTQSHARWMISTVFWVLSPATTRLSFVPLGMIFQPKEFSDFPFTWPEVLGWNQILITLVIGLLIFLDLRKEKKIFASYALAAFGQLFSLWVVFALKDAEWLISLFDHLFEM